MDIKNLSANELKKLHREISDAIQSRYEQEKEALQQEVRELVKKKAGTTVEELFGFSKGKGTAKRAKAAAKYRNPADHSQTWTGRGRAPVWMQNLLNAGKKKESFLIK